MPITITEPVGGWVGPGLRVTALTDFIGPLPTTTNWRIVVETTDGEGILWATVLRDYPHPAVSVVVAAPTDLETHATPSTARAGGASVRIHVYLYQDLLTLLEDATADVQWEPTSALYNVLQQGAALTSEDRATINATLANTTVSIPSIDAIGGFVQKGLSALFGQVPSELLHRHGALVVSGQGTIPRGTEPFRPDSIGFEWIWTVVPPGYGRLEGNTQEYFGRLAQWRTIQRDSANDLYVRDLVDASSDGQRYIWGNLPPETFEWYLPPGVVAEVRFLVYVL